MDTIIKVKERRIKALLQRMYNLFVGGDYAIKDLHSRNIGPNGEKEFLKKEVGL